MQHLSLPGWKSQSSHRGLDFSIRYQASSINIYSDKGISDLLLALHVSSVTWTTQLSIQWPLRTTRFDLHWNQMPGALHCRRRGSTSIEAMVVAGLVHCNWPCMLSWLMHW